MPEPDFAGLCDCRPLQAAVPGLWSALAPHARRSARSVHGAGATPRRLASRPAGGAKGAAWGSASVARGGTGSGAQAWGEEGGEEEEEDEWEGEEDAVSLGGFSGRTGQSGGCAAAAPACARTVVRRSSVTHSCVSMGGLLGLAWVASSARAACRLPLQACPAC
jgi:hypothetical protein